MRVPPQILLLVLCLSLGCTVLDELDNANAQMDKLSGQPKDKKAEESAGAEPDKPRSSQDMSREWWKEAKSLNTKELNPAIVSCRIGGDVQFMAHGECLNRGGQAKRPS